MAGSSDLERIISLSFGAGHQRNPLAVSSAASSWKQEESRYRPVPKFTKGSMMRMQRKIKRHKERLMKPGPQSEREGIRF
jgi:hypothetical protein